MDFPGVRLLTVAPYRFLPATTGGHQGIALMAHYLGQRCENHVLSVESNAAEHPYAFHLHRALPAGARRYLPFAATGIIKTVARQMRATHLLCDHPYLFPAAWKAARALRIPAFLRSHNLESERFRTLGKRWWRGMWLFERWAMRSASTTFFVTGEDRQWAIRHYGLHPGRCHTAPFGTELNEAPRPSDPDAKKRLGHRYGFDEQADHVLYFIGALRYGPNADAVRVLLSEIVPRLAARGGHFHLLIGGGGLAESISVLAVPHASQVSIPGFVDDLDEFLAGCDLMVNPVLTGGGIKTKLVEALAHGKTVVSTASGAAGVDVTVCGGALNLVNDGDWDAFAAAIDSITSAVDSGTKRQQAPPEFYRRYYWGHVAGDVLRQMLKT